MSKKTKIKVMCGLSNDLSGELLADFIEAVQKPRFYCKKCYRVARKKKHLCRPVSLPVDSES